MTIIGTAITKGSTFKNLALSLSVHGRQYVSRIRMRDCMAGILFTSISCLLSLLWSTSDCCCFNRVSVLGLLLAPLMPLLLHFQTVHMLPPSMLMSTSALRIETRMVRMINHPPVNLTNPLRLTRPTSGLLDRLNRGRHRFSLLEASLRAKNPT